VHYACNAALPWKGNAALPFQGNAAFFNCIFDRIVGAAALKLIVSILSAIGAEWDIGIYIYNGSPGADAVVRASGMSNGSGNFGPCGNSNSSYSKNHSLDSSCLMVSGESLTPK